ncbi:MAG: leucine-rich repeat domain-containing protein [Bacteroidaceae bacterium]|nr:leucine-rich repeat domain-containing protein [Bacteroidaceae bacterium]
MDEIKTRLDKIADSYQLIYETTDNAIVFPNIASWELNNKITCNVIYNGVGRMIFNEPITNIPESFFLGCENLKSIIIPSSCRVIHNFAFFTCKNLERIKLHTGLRIIGERALSKTGLKRVEIPSTLIFVSDNAFDESKLRYMKLKTPTSAYRYFGVNAIGQNIKIDGISKFDDFHSTALG